MAHTPRPPRPKLKIRVKENAPMIDIGVDLSELLVGMIDTLDRLCRYARTSPHPNLYRAIKVLKLHKAIGTPAGKVAGRHLCSKCSKPFKREDLLAGDGAFLGWCVRCDMEEAKNGNG